MRKLVTMIFFALGCLMTQAQFADYELLGFVDENDNVVTAIDLNESDSLQPRIAIRNNGPSTIAADDTLNLLISVNGQYVGRTFIAGSRLSGLTSGRVAYIEGRTLFTAEQLNEIYMPSFELCYEVSYLYDTVPANNAACVTINHPVGIADFSQGLVSLFPNPATEVFTMTNVAGADVVVCDMMGRVVFSARNLSEIESVNVSNWTNGLYLVRISKGRQMMVKKLNIAH